MKDPPEPRAMAWSWNEPPLPFFGQRPTLQDETLRDGLQSASVCDPTADEKIELLHAMEALGIDVVNVGLPAASAKNRSDTEALSREIVRARLRIKPAAAARALVSDIAPIVEVAQRAGIAIEVYTFIGSSAIRALVEDWSLERMVQRTTEAVAFAAREGLPVCYVTEDTTRARPEVLSALFDAALSAGATRLCLADTVGAATPDGVHALVSFTRARLLAGGHLSVGIDWHGHNDRGLVLMNALAALAAGVDRLHGCALGVGERCGNAPMELLLANVAELEGAELDREEVLRYCALAARILDWQVSPLQPVIGGRSSGPASAPTTAEAATTRGLAR